MNIQLIPRHFQSRDDYNVVVGSDTWSLRARTVRALRAHKGPIHHLYFQSGIECCHSYGTRSQIPFKKKFFFYRSGNKIHWCRNRVMARIFPVVTTRNRSHAYQYRHIDWCYVQVREADRPGTRIPWLVDSKCSCATTRTSRPRTPAAPTVHLGDPDHYAIP